MNFYLCIFIYLCFFILSFVTCSGYPVGQPKINTTATEGSRVFLFCDCTNMSSKSAQVDWRFSSNIEVFERSKKGSSAGNGYEGRVDVPEDQFLKGNCSLELKNISSKDAGEYRCFFVVNGGRRLVQPVELSVEDKEIEPDVYREKPETSSSQEVEPSSNTGTVVSIISFILCLCALVLLCMWKRKRQQTREPGSDGRPNAAEGIV
ncbi:uncharacterized protein [Hoplias malabaricus]|uniref:uncharacterized protein n=1 Tax=Hoplias malabaricus TaxID=27720 RepID=UPI003461FE1D